MIKGYRYEFDNHSLYTCLIVLTILQEMVKSYQ
jgi:hypothetical protein